MRDDVIYVMTRPSVFFNGTRPAQHLKFSSLSITLLVFKLQLVQFGKFKTLLIYCLKWLPHVMRDGVIYVMTRPSVFFNGTRPAQH
ncbi:hypothetical protein NDU88_001770 [Pleurodeles waltl]|uniref:Uncharacterized protein n=1 Tax=Pleurodeles waltl TaxID=8319 RepID=A0AAV7NBQ1_PLEWA|nr:hypothetical protein NDU88_001770 [Pleurodeles waltl]